MFSMMIHIPWKSELGQKLPFIQHIAVVAFVKTIRDREGYEKLQLNIKWPNDIYVKRNVKIGGVIVNTSLWDGSFNVVIGLGVNLSNQKPTESVNSLIRGYNKENGTQLMELNLEDVLADTMNTLEGLVDIFQQEGMEVFKQQYYRYWMHR